MYIVAIAWVFVVLLMAAAEAASSQGTVLGALVTLLLYGALPLSIVLYLMGTPGRRRARLLAEQGADTVAPTVAGSRPDGDGGGHAPGAPITPVREEP